MVFLMGSTRHGQTSGGGRSDAQRRGRHQQAGMSDERPKLQRVPGGAK